jgi:hypothetical protein
VRVGFEVGPSTIRGELTSEGEAWIWQLLAGQQRNAQGALSDHLGRARLIAGDGRPPRDQPRLTGAQTTYAELDAGYPQLNGPRATFRAQLDAPFIIGEVGLVSVQSVLIARSSVKFDVAPGAYPVTAVLELAPTITPLRRNELLFALM